MTAEKKLEEVLAKPVPVRDEREAMNRRQFLRGAAVGGAAGLAVAAGTGVAVWRVSDAEAQATIQAAEAEIARLQGLVERYETLEKVGLDAILETGMMAMAVPLKAVEAGAGVLKDGLDLVEERLLAIEEALPTAAESILWIEDKVTVVSEGIEKLETALGNVLEKASDNPVAEAVKDFAAMVVDNLPFGLGDRFRDTLDGFVELVTSVDELVAGINTRLLEPMRTQWFSTDEGKGLGSLLILPLVEHVLDPLEEHLNDLSGLAASIQNDLVSPTQLAMEERASVRSDINRYKAENGIE